MYLLVLCFTGLCKGCSGSIEARQTAAQQHHFSMMSAAGSRYEQASSESIGEVRRALVIARVPLHCVLENCLTTPAVPALLGPKCLASGGLHQMSTLYKILERATPM